MPPARGGNAALQPTQLSRYRLRPGGQQGEMRRNSGFGEGMPGRRGSRPGRGLDYLAIWRSRSSSSVLQSMQRVAVGRASRRLRPISMPQLSQ